MIAFLILLFQLPQKEVNLKNPKNNKSQDRVRSLLENSDADPYLRVLRNYFRQIKSSPLTLQKLEALGLETTTETYNVNAGLDTGFVSHNKHKKPKYNQKKMNKKKKKRRKIFLTANEAFSESYYGREMREMDEKYIVYVPVSELQTERTQSLKSDDQVPSARPEWCSDAPDTETSKNYIILHYCSKTCQTMMMVFFRPTMTSLLQWIYQVLTQRK